MLPEFCADLFSHHASSLVYVFMAVDERDEDVMSDEIFRRCSGKQQTSRGGRRVQLPDCFILSMNKIKRHHIIAPISTWEGGKERKKDTKINEEARVARRSSNTVLCYTPGTRWQTGDRGRRVDRKGLDGGRDRTTWFLILMKKSLFQ